ncbi:hypothetical protein BU14_1946s0001, partial [Porphyra umbilicalis]
MTSLSASPRYGAGESSASPRYGGGGGASTSPRYGGGASTSPRYGGGGSASPRTASRAPPTPRTGSGGGGGGGGGTPGGGRGGLCFDATALQDEALDVPAFVASARAVAPLPTVQADLAAHAGALTADLIGAMAADFGTFVALGPATADAGPAAAAAAPGLAALGG